MRINHKRDPSPITLLNTKYEKGTFVKAFYTLPFELKTIIGILDR